MANKMGRPKGSPNKRTVQKMLEAAQDVAAIERRGQKKATEVLNDLMQTAMSFAASYQQRLLAAGEGAKPGDIELFWKAMEAAGTFAKALAPYQQPKFKAIVVPAVPSTPLPGDGARAVAGKVIDMKDPNEVVRVYQQTVKRIA